YRPDRYTPQYDRAGDLVAFAFDGTGTGRVERRYVVDLDRHPTESTLLAPEAVFGDMYLVEASRGCEWGCRFCAAGYMYRPIRHRSVETLQAAAAEGLAHRATIGLVGAGMASGPGLGGLWGVVADPRGRARLAVLAQGRRHHRTARACARAERQPERDGRARGRIGTHAAGHQQEPHRARDPARGRLAGRCGRPGDEALFHDRPSDRDRRRR